MLGSRSKRNDSSSGLSPQLATEVHSLLSKLLSSFNENYDPKLIPIINNLKDSLEEGTQDAFTSFEHPQSPLLKVHYGEQRVQKPYALSKNKSEGSIGTPNRMTQSYSTTDHGYDSDGRNSTRSTHTANFGPSNRKGGSFVSSGVKGKIARRKLMKMSNCEYNEYPLDVSRKSQTNKLSCFSSSESGRKNWNSVFSNIKSSFDVSSVTSKERKNELNSRVNSRYNEKEKGNRSKEKDMDYSEYMSLIHRIRQRKEASQKIVGEKNENKEKSKTLADSFDDKKSQEKKEKTNFVPCEEEKKKTIEMASVRDFVAASTEGQENKEEKDRNTKEKRTNEQEKRTNEQEKRTNEQEMNGKERKYIHKNLREKDKFDFMNNEQALYPYCLEQKQRKFDEERKKKEDDKDTSSTSSTKETQEYNYKYNERKDFLFERKRHEALKKEQRRLLEEEKRIRERQKEIYKELKYDEYSDENDDESEYEYEYESREFYQSTVKLHTKSHLPKSTSHASESINGNSPWAPVTPYLSTFYDALKPLSELKFYTEDLDLSRNKISIGSLPHDPFSERASCSFTPESYNKFSSSMATTTTTEAKSEDGSFSNSPVHFEDDEDDDDEKKKDEKRKNLALFQKSPTLGGPGSAFKPYESSETPFEIYPSPPLPQIPDFTVPILLSQKTDFPLPLSTPFSTTDTESEMKEILFPPKKTREEKDVSTSEDEVSLRSRSKSQGKPFLERKSPPTITSQFEIEGLAKPKATTRHSKENERLVKYNTRIEVEIPYSVSRKSRGLIRTEVRTRKDLKSFEEENNTPPPPRPPAPSYLESNVSSRRDGKPKRNPLRNSMSSDNVRDSGLRIFSSSSNNIASKSREEIRKILKLAQNSSVFDRIKIFDSQMSSVDDKDDADKNRDRDQKALAIKREIEEARKQKTTRDSESLEYVSPIESKVKAFKVPHQSEMCSVKSRIDSYLSAASSFKKPASRLLFASEKNTCSIFTTSATDVSEEEPTEEKASHLLAPKPSLRRSSFNLRRSKSFAFPGQFECALSDEEMTLKQKRIAAFFKSETLGESQTLHLNDFSEETHDKERKRGKERKEIEKRKKEEEEDEVDHQQIDALFESLLQNTFSTESGDAAAVAAAATLVI